MSLLLSKFLRTAEVSGVIVLFTTELVHLYCQRLNKTVHVACTYAKTKTSILKSPSIIDINAYTKTDCFEANQCVKSDCEQILPNGQSYLSLTLDPKRIH